MDGSGMRYKIMIMERPKGVKEIFEGVRDLHEPLALSTPPSRIAQRHVKL